MQPSEQRMARLREQLEQNPGYAESLPGDEGSMVREALEGRSVYEIAQEHGTSEESVWRVLGSAAQMASGNPPQHQVETGGFGSDTDPGVTGGYGETGFGSLSADIDPGVVDSEDSLDEISPDDAAS
jgi:DNA-binding CsgD family transcriptional regulator